MAMNWCRLCAKQNAFTKDLLHENNNILKLIEEFLPTISITENNSLPTQICLNCEEAIISFQLFILNCQQAQEFLEEHFLQNTDIKEEEVRYVLNVASDPNFKLEVKNEFPTDEIGERSKFHEIISQNDAVNIENREYKVDVNIDEIGAEYLELDTNDDDDIEDVEDDNVSIASLKKIKTNNYKTSKSAKSSRTRHKKSTANYNKNIKEYVKFICRECKEFCTSWYQLEEHYKVHNMIPEVECKCGLVLKSKSSLYKHIQDHKNPETYRCDQCPKLLISLSALNKHKARHIPKAERAFVCISCDKEFRSKELLKSHEKSHIPIEERKVYCCEICNLKFTTKSAVSSHRRVVHEKVKSYVCDLCGFACGTNGELRQHAAIHSDDKPFQCKKCGKAFKTYSNLKTHTDTHEDTSYACYICTRVLNSRRTLRKHLLVHEDQCRHVCPYCNKAFKRKQTLKVHTYSHTGDKPLSCKWCDEHFSYASTLRAHRLRCHPDKMAGQAQAGYPLYTRQRESSEDYIKSDLAAIGMSKNEVEAM